MQYKKEFENTNVYVDKLKCFFVANEENREILFKLVPIIFENDVNTKTSESEPNSDYVKRETKRKKSNKLAV